MQKLFSILVASLVIGTAFAAELPSEGEFVLTASDGTVVGAGELSNGNLELELLTGFTDFATLTFVDEEGNVQTFDVMVGADGSVVFTDSFEDLASTVTNAGGEVEVRLNDEVEAEGNQAFGAAVPENVELPEEAREGMEEAAENYAEAQERAAEAQEEADERAADARDNASEGDEAADEAEENSPEIERPEDADDASEEGDSQSEEGQSNAR